MKNIFRVTFTILTLAVVLAACGSKNSSSTPPMTKAVTTLYLFGSMSSSSKVATLKTEVTVPDGLTIDHSTQQEANGNYTLTSGTIVPSGTNAISDNGISGEYNVTDRKVIINYINFPDTTTSVRKDIKSGTSGKGVEIAQLNFKLAKSNVLPVVPNPWSDLVPLVYVETGLTDIVPVPGLQVNYAIKYLP